MTKKSVSKRKRNVAVGVAHILATFNNTIVAISDLQGGVISWSSSGCNGFKGSRKSTPYAAQLTAETAAKQAMNYGLKTISIKIKGPGSGRESVVRALAAVGLTITTIEDVTPMPHNGCRPPNKRRV